MISSNTKNVLKQSEKNYQTLNQMFINMQKQCDKENKKLNLKVLVISDMFAVETLKCIKRRNNGDNQGFDHFETTPIQQDDKKEDGSNIGNNNDNQLIDVVVQLP